MSLPDPGIAPVGPGTLAAAADSASPADTAPAMRELDLEV